MHGIQEFNALKKLISNCSEKSGKVDIELIKSLIDQVNLFIKMVEIEMNHEGTVFEEGLTTQY